MNTMLATLPDQLQGDLKKIRSCVQTFGSRYPQLIKPNASPAAWADHATSLFEGWLLDEEQIQLMRLNPGEIFLLYASACLCGIGLADRGTQGKNENLGTNAPGVLAGTVDMYEGSRRLITEHWKELGIANEGIAKIIADICGNAGWDYSQQAAPPVETEHEFEGVAVNMGLLSAAIRLAGELNPKAPATVARICTYLPPSASLSDDAYDKAVTLKSLGPHPYATATIQVKIRCSDAEIHRALKHHERSVQRQLHKINQFASPRFLFSDVLYEIESDGYTPVDLKFSVDTSAALRLLTGNRLYSDNRVFLRELIQNAVDACNLRKRLEKDYQPAICVEFNEDISQVTVRDNGIGMDRQWIEKYFLTIGISLYQSSEVRSAGQRSSIDFNFISQFGIGFLSSFLVADKITIKTRQAGSGGLIISITNLRDYFDVRPLDGDFDPGTEVTLHLKPSKMNYCRSLEYIGYLKTNIRFLDIPVEFKDHQGKATTIGCSPLAYGDPKSADIDFVAPLAFKHSQGYLLLRAKMNVDHIYSVESARGGVSVFQDGIFITQLDELLPKGARQHVIGRINLLGQDKCALSMDRNRIFWTDGQLQDIKHTIRMGLADAVGRFLEAVAAQQVAPNTYQSIVNNLAIFFDFNQVDDEIHQRLYKPIRQFVEKRFRDFIRIHFVHTNRPEGIPEADGYGNQWQQRIVDSFRKN